MHPQLCADRPTHDAQCPIVDGPSLCALRLARARLFSGLSVHQSAQFGSHSKIDISPGPRTLLLLTDTLWPMSRLLTILVVILFTLISPCSGVDLAVRDAVLLTCCNFDSRLAFENTCERLRPHSWPSTTGKNGQIQLATPRCVVREPRNIFADCGFVSVTSGCVFSRQQKSKVGSEQVSLGSFNWLTSMTGNVC